SRLLIASVTSVTSTNTLTIAIWLITFLELVIVTVSGSTTGSPSSYPSGSCSVLIKSTLTLDSFVSRSSIVTSIAFGSIYTVKPLGTVSCSISTVCSPSPRPSRSTYALKLRCLTVGVSILFAPSRETDTYSGTPLTTKRSSSIRISTGTSSIVSMSSEEVGINLESDWVGFPSTLTVT